MTTSDDLLAKVGAEIAVTYLDRAGARLRNILKPRAFVARVDPLQLVTIERRGRHPAYETIYTIVDDANFTTYPPEGQTWEPTDMRRGDAIGVTGGRVPPGSVVTVTWIDRRRRQASFRVPDGTTSISLYAKLNEMTRRERRLHGRR